MNVASLLKPKKIAVVGASDKKSTFGGDTCTNIIKYGDVRQTYFVNPKRDELFGQKCYKSLDDISDNIDMVIICTSKNSVNDILQQAARKGCKGAVVFASGYSEVGTEEGKKAEKELVDLCNKLDIALMGPNCAGFINFFDKVSSFAFISADRDRKGKIGLVSQSGQICLSLMESPNMKFSYLISAGNSSVIKMEDYLDFLVDDENTKVVSLYLEGVTDPGKFVSALRKAAIKHKPIVILKTGRSIKGSQIAASHTGSLSGSDKAYDALFDKFGVIRVKDMEELLAASVMFSVLDKLPEKAAFASMNLSGGETGICADVGYLNGIYYPDFSNETLSKLKGLLPSYATPNNPLDMTASLSYDIDGYAEALRILMDDPNVGMVLIGYTLLLEIADPSIYYIVKGIEKVKSQGNTKPIAFIPFVENTRNKEYSDELEKLGIPILPPTEYAFSILKYLSNFIQFNYEEKTLEVLLPNQNLDNTAAKALSEHNSKLLLHKYGISIPKEIVSTSLENAINSAKEIGYPIVMKIESEDILHKSDIGGVVLNINNEQEVINAYKNILMNTKKFKPDAKINGVLIQEMVPKGLEVIIGVNNDPQFGPMVLCGLGGVFVEIFKDVALYPLPVNLNEALKLIKALKAFPLFNGYRGQEILDFEALADVIVNIGKLAQDHQQTLKELDINPIIVYPKGKGVKAVDGLIILRGY